MMDPFARHSRSLTAPPSAAEAIVPDDAAPLTRVTRAVYVGGGGDLRVRMLEGGIVTFAGVPGGSLIPLRLAQIYATGTSASDIVGLW